MTCSDCTVKKKHIDNNKFNVVSGKEFYGPDGLHFPDIYHKADGTYRSIFGPVCYHSAVIYARNDYNMALALRRQTNAREPELEGLDRWLRQNGTRFIKTSTPLATFIEKLRVDITMRVAEIKDYSDLLADYVHEPHPKRNERVCEYQRQLDTTGCDHETFVQFVTGAVKKAEHAKYGKYARLFVSMGPAAIFAGGFMMRYLKESFYHVTTDDGLEFVPGPNAAYLQPAFERFLNTPDIHLLYFSDDSVLAVQCTDGLWTGELDFSSCDMSHVDELFELFISIGSYDQRLQDRLIALVKQCRAAIKIKSCTNFKDLCVLLQPLMAVLYSGSSLTTVINNLAEVVLFSSIKSVLPPLEQRYKANIKELVHFASQRCGYIVTCVEALYIEELTFLKYFPCIVGGQVTFCLSLGVILRTIGSCWGDLPGSGDIDSRAYRWNQMIVRAFIDAGQNSIVRVLSDMFNAEIALNYRTEQELARRLAKVLPYDGVMKSLLPIADIHIARRYRVDTSEVQFLCLQLLDSVHYRNAHLRSGFTDMIFEKDYGLVASNDFSYSTV